MTNKIITGPRASTLIYGLINGNAKGVWILPANVCPAVPLILVETKTPFEFVDINRQSLCLDISLVKARIRNSDLPAIAGVIYVRTYGSSASAIKDIKALRESLGSSALLIDDQCLGLPNLELENQLSYGADAAIFSTGYSKIFDLGYGGFGKFYNKLDYNPPINHRDPDIYDGIMQKYKMAIVDDYPLYENETVPNQIPSWVSGGRGPDWFSLKREMESKWQAVITHKEQLNSIYKKGLADFSPLDDTYQNWRFNIRVRNSKTVLRALFNSGLFASDHYYPSARLWGVKHTPNSTNLYETVINLFNDKNFSVKQAKHAVDIIQNSAEKLQW